MQLQDLEQFKDLGITFLLGFFFIQQFFVFLKSWKNGKNVNGVKEQLQFIGENHLDHIHEAIKTQTEALNYQTKLFQEDHQKNYEMLIQIKEGINSLKERK